MWGQVTLSYPVLSYHCGDFWFFLVLTKRWRNILGVHLELQQNDMIKCANAQEKECERKEMNTNVCVCVFIWTDELLKIHMYINTQMWFETHTQQMFYQLSICVCVLDGKCLDDNMSPGGHPFLTHTHGTWYQRFVSDLFIFSHSENVVTMATHKIPAWI